MLRVNTEFLVALVGDRTLSKCFLYATLVKVSDCTLLSTCNIYSVQLLHWRLVWQLLIIRPYLFNLDHFWVISFLLVPH